MTICHVVACLAAQSASSEETPPRTLREESQSDLRETPVSDTQPSSTDPRQISQPPNEVEDPAAKLLGRYRLVKSCKQATPKTSPQFKQRWMAKNMWLREFNSELEKLGFTTKQSNSIYGVVSRDGLWVELL
jgi:hypothetical protein